MTSFMSKKKKYKFQVEICLEQLLEVPFVSAAVLFAKLRLLDGGSFQDHSSRQEVRDHKVTWDAKFSFPCKMMANASTGVMEKCILRISIRKESKGGRSFTKLGLVDLNLAEYAGAGLIHKKALLEGYDARHRQDNSMLKFRIQLNMISGDILFKAPSPSLKHKQIPIEETSTDQRSDEFSSGSLAGSINSGSSGFGSLPKKRTPLPADLVIGQTLTETGSTITTMPYDMHQPDIIGSDQHQTGEHNTVSNELGHTRNSSNTSQMSKASGYSSISHSRQSSGGDSTAGHIRNALQHESLRRPTPKLHRTYTFPKHRLTIPTTIMSESPGPPPLDSHRNDSVNSEIFHTPQNSFSDDGGGYFTPLTETPKPKMMSKQFYSPAVEEVLPETTFNVFDRNFNLQKSASSGGVMERVNGLSDVKPQRNSTNTNNLRPPPSTYDGVLRSKSEFVIPKLVQPNPPTPKTISNVISQFFTPRLPRKEPSAQSTPIPPFSSPLSKDESRAASMGNLKFNNEGHFFRLHRKMLLDGKLVTCDNTPGNEDINEEINGESDENPRRRSTTLILNPSSGSIQTSSDTGSLDRAKAAYHRRQNKLNVPDDTGPVSGRVETTRVDTEDIIAEVLKSTNLELQDEAETSGLQLYINKDGTASLGSHEVKSQMSTGVNTFKKVIMDNR